jgi:uncharacterized protein YccT (UPF0319 family)
MKNRPIIIGLTIFCAVLLLTAGCTKTKTYRMSEQGKDTASLTYPNFIEVDSFDGESVEGLLSGILYEGKKEVLFPAGAHTVVMRYYDMWDIDDNDHEKVYSNYITLRFDAKAGNRYKVSVDAPKDRRSAWKLASHFSADIIDVRTGKTVSY